MLKAQSDRGSPGHRISSIDKELEVYVAVLRRLVHKVGPFFVARVRKTKADRLDIDGGIEACVAKNMVSSRAMAAPGEWPVTMTFVALKSAMPACTESSTSREVRSKLP